MRRGRHRREPTASTPGPRSWREVAGEVERLRGAYAQAGYGHGHRVGLLLENRPAFFTHWLALNALGVSIVPIHADMRSAELTYLIGHSEMSLAVDAAGSARAALRAAAAEAGATLDTIRPEVAGRIPAARSPARLGREPIGRNSECALLYTSGTTGRPKGCLLANDYFLRAGEWYLGLHELAEVVPDIDRFITPLPLSHMNAIAFSSMAVILSGGCIVQLDRFHPSTWWQSVRDSRRDDRPLPRRDAGDAAGGAGERARSPAQACASASAPASTRATTRRSRSASAFRCSRRGR